MVKPTPGIVALNGLVISCAKKVTRLKQITVFSMCFTVVFKNTWLVYLRQCSHSENTDHLVAESHLTSIVPLWACRTCTSRMIFSRMIDS